MCRACSPPPQPSWPLRPSLWRRVLGLRSFRRSPPSPGVWHEEEVRSCGRLNACRDQCCRSREGWVRISQRRASPASCLPYRWCARGHGSACCVRARGLALVAMRRCHGEKRCAGWRILCEQKPLSLLLLPLIVSVSGPVERAKSIRTGYTKKLGESQVSRLGLSSHVISSCVRRSESFPCSSSKDEGLGSRVQNLSLCLRQGRTYNVFSGHRDTSARGSSLLRAALVPCCT